MSTRRARLPIASALAAAVLALACARSPAQSAPAEPKQEGPQKEESHVTTVYDFEAKTIDGETIRLDRYRGKVLLVVNVASKCGFTPQYEALEALHRKHAERGLVVLGFPCDQFGHQEPGTEAEIKTFCTTRYSVTFPLFSKIEVNGANAHPLYRFLRAEQPGSFSKELPGVEQLYAHLEKTQPELLGTDAVKWNFTKFLVDRRGKVVRRFESVETPQAFEAEVVAKLDESG
jgi:glutathione peroxidase